jgi:hypothetical protein
LCQPHNSPITVSHHHAAGPAIANVALQECRRPSRGDRFPSRACRRPRSRLAVGGPVARGRTSAALLSQFRSSRTAGLGRTGSGLAFCIGNLVLRGLGAPRQEREDLLRRAGSRFTPGGATPMACPLLLRRSSAGGPELRRIAAATIRWRWNSRPRRAAAAERPARSRCWACVFCVRGGFPVVFLIRLGIGSTERRRAMP